MPRALFIGGDHDGEIIDVPENSARHNMPRAIGWQTYHRHRFEWPDGSEVLVFVYGLVNFSEVVRRAGEFAEVPPFLLKG